MIDRTKMTLNGTVLTVFAESAKELCDWALMQGFSQFSISCDGEWQLSAPLDDKQKVAYTWLFHRMQVERAKSEPEPPKTPPRGPTPPSGGSPAAGQQEAPQELLMAVA